MTTPKRRRKNVKGANFVRFGPQGLNLVNADPTIKTYFEQVGCIRFCEKHQGYNKHVAREFSKRSLMELRLRLAISSCMFLKIAFQL